LPFPLRRRERGGEGGERDGEGERGREGERELHEKPYF